MPHLKHNICFTTKKLMWMTKIQRKPCHPHISADLPSGGENLLKWTAMTSSASANCNQAVATVLLSSSRSSELLPPSRGPILIIITRVRVCFHYFSPFFLYFSLFLCVCNFISGCHFSPCSVWSRPGRWGSAASPSCEMCWVMMSRLAGTSAHHASQYQRWIGVGLSVKGATAAGQEEQR